MTPHAGSNFCTTREAVGLSRCASTGMEAFANLLPKRFRVCILSAIQTRILTSILSGEENSHEKVPSLKIFGKGRERS
jgi:hypothetical protein